MENETNTTETEELDNTLNNDNKDGSTVEQTPELKAALELVKEGNDKIEALTKEVNELKKANAKLAIQQSYSAPQQSDEDIINKMFK